MEISLEKLENIKLSGMIYLRRIVRRLKISIMIKEIVRKLNNPQFGSFGEYIFADYATNALKYNVKKIHRDGVDFSINNIRVDVGASRKLEINYKGKKKIPKKDVFVFFYNDCCFIDYPDNFEVKLNWSYILEQYEKWSKSRIINIPTEEKVSYKREYDNITVQIKSFFSLKGYGARIIYRTVSHTFGLRESPDNLLPKDIKPYSVSVYLDFNDFKRMESNIRFIIAFIDTKHDDIPRQNNIALKSGRDNSEKIDLTQIVPNKHKCCFKNIQELEAEFFIRYQNETSNKKINSDHK